MAAAYQHGGSGAKIISGESGIKESSVVWRNLISA